MEESTYKTCLKLILTEIGFGRCRLDSSGRVLLLRRKL